MEQYQKKLRFGFLRFGWTLGFGRWGLFLLLAFILSVGIVFILAENKVIADPGQYSVDIDYIVDPPGKQTKKDKSGAQILVKKTQKKNEADFEQGDIVHAFNEKRLLKVYAEIITNPKKATRNQDTLIEPNSLLDIYLQNTKEYKFERISENELKRINLETGEQTIISETPNQDKEQMDVQLFINRRLKSDRHQIFGTKGQEYWYGGNDITTNEKLNIVWDQIESKTNRNRTEATAENLFGINTDDYELIPVEDFTDEERGELESPLTDDTDPENPKTLKERKYKVDLDSQKVKDAKDNKDGKKSKASELISLKQDPNNKKSAETAEILGSRLARDTDPGLSPALSISDNKSVSNNKKSAFLRILWVLEMIPVRLTLTT